MNGSKHERARDLLLSRDIEGVSKSDGMWLESHLVACTDCADFAGQLQLTSRALRSAPVMASSSLVSATQARVRKRASELRDQRARNFLVGISFCLGLLWSAGSAFVGLKLSGWLADKIHVAPWIIAGGLVIFWLAPAIAVAIGLLVQHPLSNPARTDWLAARIKEDLL
jgi:hypothetical protein